jgi:Mg-chelatase subunit ChlD
MADSSSFDLLARAIAGRWVAMRKTRAGELLAYSDGRSIFLPRALLADDANAWRAVVAQSLMVHAGSLEFERVRALIGRPAAARRYAWLEVLRAVAHRHGEVPRAFLQHPAFTNHGTITVSRTQSIRRALTDSRLGDAIPEFVGTVRPLAVAKLAIAARGPGALTRQSDIDGSSSTIEPQELSDEDETENSKILRMFENRLASNNLIAQWFAKLFEMRRGGGDEEVGGGHAGGGAEIRISPLRRAWRRGTQAVQGTPPPLLPGWDETREARSFIYPEWDEAARRYRYDWVSVQEVDPWRMEGPRDLSAILVPPTRELQRQLSGLGVDYEMSRRQPEGADLDTGRLIERAIEIRARVSTSIDDVYRASRKTRRDLGVVVITDISGSTEETNNSGESVFQQHLRAAHQIARTLDRLGDCVALYGFQSWGRRLVQFARLKGHGEAWGGMVAERLAMLEPLGFTRTGAAVRHANHLLLTSMRLPNRLMVLITDGFCYDQDYEGDYAEADTRKALAEARTAGIACVCLCIGGSQSADKLRAVFARSNLLIIDDARDIHLKIRRVCSDALTAVSRRRIPGASRQRAAV